MTLRPSLFVLAHLGIGCTSVDPILLTPAALQGEQERIMQLEAPRYSGSGEMGDRQRFLDVAVPAWASYREYRTRRLTTRYEAAISETDELAKKAEIYEAMARLEWDFCREFFEANESAFPSADGYSATSRQTYFSGVVTEMRERLDIAMKAADACLQHAKPTPHLTRAHCERVKVHVGTLQRTWLPHSDRD